MKKILILTVALALVAVAVPALAQIDANDVNNNGIAQGNTSGNGNNNDQQFINANLGDNSGQGSAINKSTISVGAVGSNNDTTLDFSTAPVNKSPITTGAIGSGNVIITDGSGVGSLLNKSTFNVIDSVNGNRIGGSDITIGFVATASGNNNDVFVGPMTFAHQFEFQNTHQFDHQILLTGPFTGADGTFYLPLSPVHLQQANTGLKAGDGGGATSGETNISQANFTGTNVAGLVSASTNLGGVAQNQAAANVVTAFAP